jgi:hypothetical protein
MNNPWKEIKTPAQDVLSRRADYTHPLELFWGRDSYGRFLFIYEFTDREGLPKKLPELNGIEVRLFTPEKHHTKKCMLLLVLKDKKDWEIFLSLCTDIITATREFEKDLKATKVILRRLSRWQEFLKKARSDLLPENIIKGLIGELLFISRHLSSPFGMDQAIQFWQGPEDLPQDFNIENCAVEVKCQLGATAPHVHISSADQLCSQLPEMYLYVVTLGKADADTEMVINLPLLINQIREELESGDPSAIERFNNLLYQTGYIDSDGYIQFSYILVNEKMFTVRQGFPRICPDELSAGIIRLGYDIGLLECEEFSATPEWMEIS